MSHRVLVADPHEQMRAAIRSVFEKAGWQVVAEAADGQEAIERCKSCNPELVVLEMSMPVKSGIEAAAEIREICPAAKLLMFTIHDSEAVREEVLRIGFDGYAAKLFAGSDLLSEAKRLLGES